MKTSYTLILVSLIAAASMLVVSYFLEEAQTINYIIIALWFIPFTTLSARAAKDSSANKTDQ